MACLIIRDGRRQDCVFALRNERVGIGRHDGNELTLPNVSVSRQHARLRQELEGWFLEDAGSQNGVKVNDRPVQRQMLVTGDRIQIGRYVLIFVADELAEPVFEGKLVEALPRWMGATRVHAARTFRFDPGDLARARQRRDTTRQLTLRGDRGDTELKDAVVTLGPGHDVPVRLPGRAGVKVAELRRTSRGYQLVKLDRWATVKVNGVTVLRRELRPGDKLLVGESTFTFEGAEG